MDTPGTQAELLFANSDATSKRYQREVAAGRMRRIARGIYTPNLRDSVEIVVQRNIFDLIDHRFPGTVLSHRTAIEIGAPVKPHIFLTGAFKKERNDVYPGVTIHVLPGATALPGDFPFRRFHISGPARGSGRKARAHAHDHGRAVHERAARQRARARPKTAPGT